MRYALIRRAGQVGVGGRTEKGTCSTYRIAMRLASACARARAVRGAYSSGTVHVEYSRLRAVMARVFYHASADHPRCRTRARTVALHDIAVVAQQHHRPLIGRRPWRSMTGTA